MSEKASVKKGARAESFTAEEKAAMKARAQELKAEAKAGKDRAVGEKDLQAAIAEMKDADRTLATQLHEIVTTCAPELMPKTWYGMPAYARDGKVVCFFQSAQKFGARYATLGFNDAALLDEGVMWPTAFALKEMTAEVKASVAELVRKAVS